jgi:hypothetical protein
MAAPARGARNTDLHSSRWSLKTPAELIAEECDALKTLLLEKNKKYGNSALEPSRIFSRADPVEQIKVRIDDKLSRIRTTGEQAADEDTALDLCGYLILLRVAKRKHHALRVAELLRAQSERA